MGSSKLVCTKGPLDSTELINIQELIIVQQS